MNYIHGVISVPNLLYSIKEGLLENLKDQNVIEGQGLSTKNLILIFNSPTLPTRIKAVYLSCAIRLYIPNHLRCFHCQHYSRVKTVVVPLQAHDVQKWVKNIKLVKKLNIV